MSLPLVRSHLSEHEIVRPVGCGGRLIQEREDCWESMFPIKMVID
jgi:hypothetical protein